MTLLDLSCEPPVMLEGPLRWFVGHQPCWKDHSNFCGPLAMQEGPLRFPLSHCLYEYEGCSSTKRRTLCRTQ